MVVIIATYTYEIDMTEDEWSALTESQQFSHIEVRSPDTTMIVCEPVS